MFPRTFDVCRAKQQQNAIECNSRRVEFLGAKLLASITVGFVFVNLVGSLFVALGGFLDDTELVVGIGVCLFRCHPGRVLYIEVIDGIESGCSSWNFFHE